MYLIFSKCSFIRYNLLYAYSRQRAGSNFVQPRYDTVGGRSHKPLWFPHSSLHKNSSHRCGGVVLTIRLYLVPLFIFRAVPSFCHVPALSATELITETPLPYPALADLCHSEVSTVHLTSYLFPVLMVYLRIGDI